MRKLDRKGFTLIELLAVITILGILMIVAIPAVSRTIENSRRNTFLSTAKQYANAVKTAFAADEIKCVKTDDSTPPKTETFSATTLTNQQAFWIPIQTDSSQPDSPGSYAYDNAKELVNQGGVSSWGNAHVSGWVVGLVTQTTSAADNRLRQEVKYYIELIDANQRGIELPYASVGTGTGAILEIKSLDAVAASGSTPAQPAKTLKESDDLERADVYVSNATALTQYPNANPANSKVKIVGSSAANVNFLCHLG